MVMKVFGAVSNETIHVFQCGNLMDVNAFNNAIEATPLATCPARRARKKWRMCCPARCARAAGLRQHDPIALGIFRAETAFPPRRPTTGNVLVEYSGNLGLGYALLQGRLAESVGYGVLSGLRVRSNRKGATEAHGELVGS